MSKIIITLLFLISLLSCSTGEINTYFSSKSKAELVKLTSQVLDFTKTSRSEQAVREKMGRFQKILRAGGPKNLSDWKLHDELLEAYIQLKSQRQTSGLGIITVPGHSQAKYQFNSFCLDGNSAIPARDEHFEWKRSDPGITYYKEILALLSQRTALLSQEKAQALIWNLQNETYWEEYPDEMKAILLKVDPNAQINLPSKSAEKVKRFAQGLLSPSLERYGQVSDALERARGQYRRFEDIQKEIQTLKSKFPLEASDNLETLEGTSLYAETSSHGYYSQIVTFLNPSDKSALINLSEYHLVPKRKDVQRIGLTYTNNMISLLNELEELLYGGLLRLGIGFTPGVNDVADLYELLYGKDFVSQKALSWDERLASGVGIALGSGTAYRHAKRWIYAPEKYLPKFESELEKQVGRALGRPGDSSVSLMKIAAEKGSDLSNSLDYQGIKKLSEILKSNPNIDRIDRVGIIRSFEAKSIKMRIIQQDEVVHRWHNSDSEVKQIGRFVTSRRIEDPNEARTLLALPEKNRALVLDEFQLKSGSEVFEGKVAPNFNQIGGEVQIFISGPLNKNLKFIRRIK